MSELRPASNPRPVPRRLAVAALSASALVVATLVPAAVPARAAGSAAPTITLSAAGGPATVAVNVQGSGFRAGETVDLSIGTAPAGTAVAAADSRIPETPAKVPATTQPGYLQVTATGRSSHLTAQSRFMVKSDWTQYRFDAGNTGWNPYENTITPSTVSGLTQRWDVDAVELGLVANGFAYTHEANGVDAVRSPATGAALRRTPVATLISGRYRITYDGSALTAVDAYTDAVRWRRPLESGVTEVSTVVVGNSVYQLLAGRSLVKLEASSGRVVWSVAAAAHGRQLVADGTGVYYVSGQRQIGRTDDTPLMIHGLSASTGAGRWVQPYATYDDGPPTLGGSSLFFVDNNSVVALNTTTGARRWSKAIDVHRLGYADGRVLLNGLDTTTANWTPYTAALDAGTGQTLWSHPDGDGVVAAGGLVYASTLRGVTILDLHTGTGLRKLDLGAGASATGLAIANGSLFVGYNVWALDQPTLLRSAERAYALPNVPPSFLVLDDTAAELRYGPGWRVGSNADDYRGADHYTETAGATATFTFTGTGFRYWFSTAAHHGIAGVSIDGGTETRIDQYAATRSDGRTSWTSPRLASGRHTVRIRATGDRHPAASARVITIDRIELGRN